MNQYPNNNGTPNSLDDVTKTANTVERTAGFINSISNSAAKKAADAYDFSWHGGASRNFGANSGNMSSSNGSFGGGTGSFVKRAPSLQQETAIASKASASGGEGSSSIPSKAPRPAQVNFLGGDSSSFGKTSVGQSATLKNSTGGMGTVAENRGSVASYTDDKFGTGTSSSSLHRNGKFNAGANVNGQLASAGRYSASSVTARNTNVSLATAIKNSRATVESPQNIQTGAYTRTSAGIGTIVTESGQAVLDAGKSVYSQSEASQGYHQVKRRINVISDMSGITGGFKTVQNAVEKTAIRQGMSGSPKFDVDALNLDKRGIGSGANRAEGVNRYRVVSESFDARSDLSHNKRVLEAHFRDLKLDVSSLSRTQIDKLVRGESIGFAGRRYQLVHEEDRKILREYSHLKSLDKNLNGTNRTRFAGLKNTGKAWAEATVGESDAYETQRAINQAYKAGKVSVKAGMGLSKAVVSGGMYMAGGTMALASKGTEMIGKIGFNMSSNPLAKAKWGSTAGVSRSLDNVSKVLLNGGGRVTKFSVKNQVRGLVRSTKANVIGKALGSRNPIVSKTAKSLSILRRRLLNIQARILNNRVMKAVLKPVVALIPVVRWIKLVPIIAAAVVGLVLVIWVVLVNSINSVVNVNDAQYRGEETIEDTGAQQAVNYIKGWQDSYEYNLIHCDADKFPENEELIGTVDDPRAYDPYTGEFYYKRRLPEKWKKQMDLWLGRYSNNAEPDTEDEEEYRKYITSIYDEDGVFSGYNMDHYWGPEAKKYHYDAKKFGSETSKGCHEGFFYFTYEKEYKKDDFGNEHFTGKVKAVRKKAQEYNLIGIGSLEKDAGVYTQVPNTSDTGDTNTYIDYKTNNWPRIPKATESYQYNGDKQNTDTTVQYIFRGSEYSYKYTDNKALYFIHTDDETETDYSMYTFFRNMVSCAYGYTGNSEEKQKDFYFDYMWELFDQNCNGLKGEDGSNINNDLRTCAKIDIKPEYENDGYYINKVNDAAGKRPNVYICDNESYSGKQELPDDCKKANEWKESAIYWTYKDTNLEEYYNTGRAGGYPISNMDEVREWVDDKGYLEQCCWARSCETYPRVYITFQYTGVQDMMWLLDGNHIVDNEWSHK